MKYYNVKVKPDVINGDVSTVIGTTGGDADFAAGDLVFDWTAFYIPKGTSKIENVALYMNGEDGSTPVATDIYLFFARDVDSIAPLSAGTVNAAGITSCFNLSTNFLGAMKIEGSSTGIGKMKGPAHGNIYVQGAQSNAGHMNFPVLEGEESSSKPGYSKVYVCGIVDPGSDDLGFKTNVLANAAVGDATAATTTTGIVVKTTDARRAFQKGDTIYIMDSDTAIGVVKSVPDDTHIVLESANDGAIAEDDEIVNANPIKISLGLVQG